MLDIIPTVEKWLAEGQNVALATVVSTWGSAPRSIGAKMAISESMAMAGSVSGGCVETAVVDEALKELKKNRPKLLNYGVSDDTAWEVGLACGGKIAILVEPLDKTWWQIMTDRIHQNCPATTITLLDADHIGQKILLGDGQTLYSTLTPDRVPSITDLNQSQTARIQNETTDVLVDTYRPAPRLVIIGGAHVAIALKNIAHIMGFRVVLIDPRDAFTTPDRFPDVEHVSHDYPDKALQEIGLNSSTYIAILTHDPKIDDPALRVALPSNAPYVGVLSSKRTHEKRLERLTEQGVDPALFPRIHTPIGINIGAQTPEEIALCIMAEIVAVRNGVLA